LSVNAFKTPPVVPLGLFVMWCIPYHRVQNPSLIPVVPLGLDTICTSGSLLSKMASRWDSHMLQTWAAQRVSQRIILPFFRLALMTATASWWPSFSAWSSKRKMALRMRWKAALSSSLKHLIPPPGMVHCLRYWINAAISESMSGVCVAADVSSAAAIYIS